VQRVPATETMGRVHTSTVTVALMPQPTDVQVHISESDVRVDVFRASGSGGQKVNTTDSAIRLTHLPTGIVIAIQDERSNQKNRAKAFTILRARLFELEREKLAMERRDSRRKQVGSGSRSEKIRTYNFPQVRAPSPDSWHRESCLHAVLRDIPNHTLAYKNRPHGPHDAILESGDRPQNQQDAS